MWGGSDSYAQQHYIWLWWNESDEGKPWVGKIIRRLLLTVIVIDIQELDPKKKPIMYNRAFVEI